MTPAERRRVILEHYRKIGHLGAAAQAERETPAQRTKRTRNATKAAAAMSRAKRAAANAKAWETRRANAAKRT